MTTNQTIDGVPRELLAQWLAMFEGGIASSPLSALRELTRKYLQTEPAAQPQGEPVAWLYTRPAQPEGVQRVPDVLLRERADPADVGDWKEQALYAGRPAPVAVVLPERKAMPEVMMATWHESKGWNDCLDELERLTTARPAHANPPPGTEPCGTHRDNDGLDEMRKPK